jgi:ABC-type glycerol-3-phosphate transport system substrate-binding protein
MSKFQIILLAVFGVFIVAAVIVFSLYRGGSTSSATVTVWGDLSQYDFNLWLNTAELAQEETLTVRYVEKPTATIMAEFTEALAQGVGPDLIIITQDQLWKEKPKLAFIPYSTISERDFKMTFVEESELFLTAEGIYALPLTIDPLVLYYNRDLLSAAGQAQPLEYWDEIYAAASNLSKRDAAGNIISSVMALGEARNISNFKDVLALLMLQAGTPITDFSGSELRSQIAASFNLPVSPAEAALEFYTQFSNPSRVYYSWNRSLIDAQTHFTSGSSAYYLGFASERRALSNKNPTLNFAVAPIPQSRVSGKTITFGRLRGLAISRAATDPGAALTMAKLLVSKEATRALSEILALPPARRDLLAVKPADAGLSVFYDAALQSKGWLDPDPEETLAIFRETIESVTSGRARTLEAVRNANDKVEALIN